MQERRQSTQATDKKQAPAGAGESPGNKKEGNKMANNYRIPADGLYHWNEEYHQWERLNRTINYKGHILRSITYHYDHLDRSMNDNHKEWFVTFPDGHEVPGFGSIKRGGDLKSIKEYIDFCIKRDERKAEQAGA